jgi:hypothetical protein
MLLKIHLGKETRQKAKSVWAPRFLGLDYKHIGRQQVAVTSQQLPPAQTSVVVAAYQQLPATGTTIFAGSEWLDSGFPEVSRVFGDF